jgi:large subunit ribosomal protein L23
MAKKAEKTTVQEKHFDVLLHPVITEKATMASENNVVTFKVHPSATKPMIKDAVQHIFKVDVVSVNTLNQEGKQKKFRGIMGRRAGYKKAMVRLKEGQKIDLAAGI